MGQAKDLLLCQKVIEARSKGSSFVAISAQFGIGYNTVRKLCHRYELEGSKGLIPRTANCGQRRTRQSEFSYRLVRLISYLHPSWGIPYILSRLCLKFPDLVLQSERHYQRRIKRHVGRLPAPVLPKAECEDRSRAPHETWQIDAKERLHFTGKAEAEGCFLNITDEKTCALLGAKAFPPGADL